MSHLITCPECNKHLQVPDDLIGKKVQCPECKHTFIAQVEVEEVSVSAKSKPTPNLPVPTNKPPAWDTKKGSDDEDDGYNVKRKRRRKVDEDEDDVDDDDDDRPSRRRGRRRSKRRENYMPHRGGLILAFGIIALVSGLGIIFGPIAWFMGNADIKEIQDGNMDPEGEGMTQTGRILGMIASILSAIGIAVAVLGGGAYFGCVCCVIFAAAGNNPNRRR